MANLRLNTIFIFFVPLFSISSCSKKIADDPVSAEKLVTRDSVGVPLKNMFGINGYEWNILQNPNNVNDPMHVYEPKWVLIKGFGSFRHYMDWDKLEQLPGKYTFSPTHSGGWNYDVIYQRAKQDSVFMLADLKSCPNWFLEAYYPAAMRDAENTPAPYNANKTSPASYILQARVAFQFAARYGYNSSVDPSLVSVNTGQRWTGDDINQVKIGLGYVRYIECDNERDKWWKGAKAQQTAQEYAANMSAFYDGDKGKLGKGVGVKNADPNMQVVVGGLANPNVQFIKDMVEWCKTNRGYRADGSVDLCFDVINYHYYSNDASSVSIQAVATKGMSPELSIAGSIADGFVKLGNSLHLPVWVTETGYDINQGSPQSAPQIAGKTALLTQADWIIRTSLFYARHGIDRVFYYQMYDDIPNGGGQYMTSGLINENQTRRPAADYILQTSKLIGNYGFSATISADPLVDKYALGKRIMYAVCIPDQKGRTAGYTLDLGGAPKANIYTLKAGADAAVKTTVNTSGGKIVLTATETPQFVEPVN